MTNKEDPRDLGIVRGRCDPRLAEKLFFGGPPYTDSLHKLQGICGACSRGSTNFFLSFPASTWQKAKNM